MLHPERSPSEETHNDVIGSQGEKRAAVPIGVSLNYIKIYVRKRVKLQIQGATMSLVVINYLDYRRGCSRARPALLSHEVFRCVKAFPTRLGTLSVVEIVLQTLDFWPNRYTTNFHANVFPARRGP